MTKSEQMSVLPAVLNRLSGSALTGTGYQALCPAHPDQQASLSIGTGTDGRVLLHVLPGCTRNDRLCSRAHLG